MLRVPVIPSLLLIPERRGLTLLELLVVLVLMALAAAVVAPVLLRPAMASVDRADALVTAARRTAIRRGQPLRLRLDADGVWGLVSERTGDPVEYGRLDTTGVSVSATRARSLDLHIDAMGTCMPANAGDGGAFDPFACRPDVMVTR